MRRRGVSGAGVGLGLGLVDRASGGRALRDRRAAVSDRHGSVVRALLLGLFGLGCLGLLGELLLLEHYEDWQQWLPLVGLGLGLGAAAWAGWRPSRRSLLSMRATSAAFVALGLLGLWLHFQGNRLFELEMDADAAGWALVWLALRGATPALAPGAMIQLGLLGLIACFRHPGLEGGSGRGRGSGNDGRVEDERGRG